MEVYKDEFWTIYFEEENQMLHPVWTENSAKLTDDTYKQEMETYTQMVEKYSPKRALIDCITFYFVITPDVQEWTNLNSFPRILAKGVTDVAILLPSDFLTQLSLEQVMDESMGIKFRTHYFDNEPDARKWLLG